MGKKKYECCSYSLLVLKPQENVIFTLPLPCGRVAPGPDQCPDCKRRRDKKILKDILREQRCCNLRWVKVPDEDEASVSRNLSRYHTRYIQFPQVNGAVFVFSSENKLWIQGHPLPQDTEELAQWVAWASQTPKGRRLSATREKWGEEGKHIIQWAWGRHLKKERNKPPGEKLIVNLRTSKLKEYLEEAGASPTWNNADGMTTYKADAQQQEKIMETLEEEGLVFL